MTTATLPPTPAGARPRAVFADQDLGWLAIDEVTIVDGFNPRTHTNTDEDTQLTESIRELGILQPLLVREAGDDYELVDGHRRLAAARAAGENRVPVKLLPAAATADDVALVANLLREALDPVDQARQFRKLLERADTDTHEKLAKRLNVSAKLISSRLQLLQLPTTAQQHIAAGSVPLAAGPKLAAIAENAPELAGTLAAAIAKGAVTSGELEKRPSNAVRIAIDSVPKRQRPKFLASATGQPISYAGRCELLEGRAKQHPRLAELVKKHANHRYDIQWTKADLDAARAYGCLLELDGALAWERASYFTDEAWTLDRLLQKLERLDKRIEREGRKKRAAGAGNGESLEAAKAAAEKEAKRKEREAAAEAARVARGTNLALGVTLARALDEAELTDPIAGIVIELALKPMFGTNIAGELAMRGMRYVREDWQTITEGRGGKTKVDYPDKEAAGEMLRQWIYRGPTPAAKVARLAQALLAALYADHAVVAQSKRNHFSIPGRDYKGGFEEDTHAGQALEQLAKAVFGKQLPKATNR